MRVKDVLQVEVVDLELDCELCARLQRSGDIDAETEEAVFKRRQVEGHNLQVQEHPSRRWDTIDETWIKKRYVECTTSKLVN